jgi:transcriptional antiterminator RfaH
LVSKVENFIKKSIQKRWYIWYTKPRAEKKIFERLTAKGIETFLPIKSELRQWSDRKKKVETPLFNGYIFTKISEKEIEKVHFTEGILNYVRFESKPAVLKQEQVDEIKLLIANALDFKIEDNVFQPGEKVIINSGPLSGYNAEIISYRGNKRLAVRIEQLGKVILVELPKIVVGKPFGA